MAMGSTGTVNITRGMLDNIKKAVDEYQQKADSLAQRLGEEVTGLIPDHFNGDAARAFETFYTENIVPANVDGLNKLLEAIRDIADSILKAIPGEGGLDEQLAEGNRQ